MLILTIRTDKPEAEVGLFDNDRQVAYHTWPAHRELSATLHRKIEALLAGHDKTIQDIQAVVCFQGPGSFTGLRIGLTVANTLAYGLQLPIVATTGEDWIKQGSQRLQTGEDDRLALPYYGAPVHITKPRS